MASTINTNINSLNAQRNLAMSQNSLATSMQRLSSGLRINSAKDDAAGLSISERFTTQIRGLNQAARNANDGISLAQTAEGALGEITSNLQRIRELAVQSANTTNSKSDRAALNQEVQQRLAEIDRVSAQTTFNSQKILDGTFGNAVFQVGADVGQTITLGLSASTRQNAIGAIASAQSGDLTEVIRAGTPAVDAVAGVTTTAAFTGHNYTNVDQVDRVDQIVFDSTDGPLENDTIEINGVTFTFVDDNSGTSTVDSGTAVSVNVDYSGGATAADATAAFNAAFALAVADTVEGTGTALVGLTAEVDGVTDTSVNITDTDLTDTDATYVISGGVTTQSTTVEGTAAQTNERTLTITNAGGTAFSVTLDGDVTNAQGLLDAIEDTAGYDDQTFTAELAGNTIVFTQKTGTTGAIVVGGTATTGTASVSATTTTTGVTAADEVDALSVDVGADDFSIAVGSATAVKVAAGNYTTQQQLVDAINAALGSTARASLDTNEDGTPSGTFSINSAETITVTGEIGLDTLGLSGTNEADGSLLTVNVSSIEASNETIQRIDSALNSVSTLRSTFGAIQNRFDSVIASLSITSENLAASRSRVQDADFAQETANLSRSQILQQAGTAMVAQANQLPQGVLALLR